MLVRARSVLERPRERSLPAAAGRIAASLVLTRLPTERRRVVRSRRFDIAVHVDLATPTGLGLYRYGWTEPLSRYLTTLVGAGGCVVDGGANIGLMTLPLARRVGPTGRVIAFEPSAGTRALLQANVELNRFGNVEIRSEALVETPGAVRFAELEAGSGTAGIVRDDARLGTPVPGVSLDEVLRGRRIDLVKLDLEGAELAALRGATEVMERCRPLLVIELEPAHLTATGGSVREIEALATDAGYVAFALVRDGGEVRETPLAGGWQLPVGATENITLRPVASA